MKKFEIWCEGFKELCMRVTAHKIGESEGDTFRDACNNLAKSDSGFREFFEDGEILLSGGCRLYDNETEARKLFG